MTYPAVFREAQDAVYRHEGGLHDDPSDPGGLTNLGIALRRHPELTATQVRALTPATADPIYFEKYWKPYGWERLPDAVAVKAYDISVDTGAKSVIEALQRALRACGAHIDDDGALGPATVDAAQKAVPGALLAALKSELAAYYRVLAAQRPLSYRRDLNGWLNRAYE